MMMRKWISSVALLALVVVNSTLVAETDHNNTDKTPAAGEVIRPPASGSLRTQESELLAYFFTQPKEVVSRVYASKLPEAVTASRAGKTEDLSKMLASLMGTLNNAQRDAVYDKSRELKDAKTIDDIKDKYLKSVVEKVFTDGDFRELTDKMFLAVSVLKGKTKDIEKLTAEDKKFIAQFDKDFDEQLTKNQEFLDNVAKATDPNSTEETKIKAKKFLRDEVNRDALMTFLDGQRNSGNQESADKLADALSWEKKDAKGQTKKFIDFIATNAKGETEMQRLLLGTSKTDIDAALKAYSNQNAFRNQAGLHGVSLSPAAFPSAQRELKFDPTADSGKGGLVDVTPIPDPVPIAAGGKPGVAPQTPAQPTTNPGTRADGAGGSGSSAAIADTSTSGNGAAIAQSRCLNCHAKAPNTPKDFNSAAGKAAAKARLTSPSRPMPPPGSDEAKALTPAEKAELTKFLDGK